MLIAGDEDVEAGAVSFRYRDGTQDNGVPVDEAIAAWSTRWSAGSTYDPGRGAGGRRGDPDHLTSQGAGSRRLRAAVDPAPDGLHRRARTSRPTARRDPVPVLPDPDALRRGGASIVRAASGLRGAQPLPVQLGHLMVCPYRHVADYTEAAGGDRGDRRAHPGRRCARPLGERRPRLQHRHEPGDAWPAPGSPPTCTSTWCPGGPATQLHADHRPHPHHAAADERHPRACSPPPGTEPRTL